MRPQFAVALLLASAICPPGASAQSGMRDGYFTRYPFEKWRAEGPVSQIKWAPKVMPARLSAHQRLLTRIQFLLPAKESDKRRGRGELIVLMEIADGAGLRWRTHEAFDLTRIPEGAKAREIVLGQNVFFLPGEYRLSLAVCDSYTMEHSFVERNVRIAPLRTDPLPEAWRGLPAVEYVRNFEPPDNWYQPYLRGRVHVPVETHRPVHLNVMMNLTPSEQRNAGPLRMFRSNMSVLLPALKVLSGVSVSEGSLDVTLLDLTHQRAWEQPDVHQLDWSKLREPFASNPSIIDVQSLAAKAEMLRFFRASVAEKLARQDDRPQARAVIVLSAPLYLRQQRKPDSVRTEKDPNRRLFYIQNRPIPARPDHARLEGTPPDDFEREVKSMDGRIFSVMGAEEFRKALASILGEISRM